MVACSLELHRLALNPIPFSVARENLLSPLNVTQCYHKRTALIWAFVELHVPPGGSNAVIDVPTRAKQGDFLIF